MSVHEFKRRLDLAPLRAAGRTWFPHWIDGYQRHCGGDAATELLLSSELMIGFLRSLCDHRVAAWRRLQAARALEMYQELMLRCWPVDFAPIKMKLHEIASWERELAAGACAGFCAPTFCKPSRRVSIELGLQNSIQGVWLTLTQAGFTPASRQTISSPHVHGMVPRLLVVGVSGRSIADRIV